MGLPLKEIPAIEVEPSQDQSQDPGHTPRPSAEVFTFTSDEQLLASMQRHFKAVSTSMRRSYRLDPSLKADFVSEMSMAILQVRQDKRHSPPYLRTVANNAARDFLSKTVKVQQREGKQILPIDTRSYTERPSSESLHSRLWVEAALSSLSASERLIVTKHLGLDESKPIKSFRRLGKLAGVGEQQAELILMGALAKIKRSAQGTKREIG